MKPTRDDFKPRRDGYFEHEGTWREVTVGTVIAQRDSRTKTWLVIDTANGPHPIPFNKSLFLRVRCQETGEEYTIPPATLDGTVVILTKDPATEEPIPRTPASDTEAVWLLIEKLDATFLAERHHESGEIHCPDYTYDSHLHDGLEQPIRRGLIEHMRFAHEMSVDGDLDLASAISLHGQAHSTSWPNIGKGGFAHRHMPEEDITKDFVLNRRIKPLPIYKTPEAS